jgi:glycosyltransferase involved in cell wall biosynthesis
MGVNLLFSAKMGNGTFQAKFVPLSMIDDIDNLFIVRKSKGPDIPKCSYIILPKICKNPIFNFIITPLYLSYYAFKYKPKFLIGYHFAMHAPFVYIASKISKVPYIFCQTGAASQTYLHMPFIKFWVRKILNNASYINTPGEQSKQYWISQGITSPINVLHSTIDTNKFISDDNIDKIYDFIFVGRLDPVKRIPLILQAIAKLYEIKKSTDSIKVAIIGDGPSNIELRNMVNQLGLTEVVDFLGFNSNVLPWLQKSKIFVMNSESEGLPVALMEAMSAELICVVPNINNIPSVVSEQITGFLFDKDNQAEFFDKLKFAYENYNSLTEMKRNARNKIIAEYSYAVAISKWKQILHLHAH